MKKLLMIVTITGFIASANAMSIMAKCGDDKDKKCCKKGAKEGKECCKKNAGKKECATASADGKKSCCKKSEKKEETKHTNENQAK